MTRGAVRPSVEIDRQSLIDGLNLEAARVVLLVAPPGYGKSTLARQWLARKESVWFQADASVTDVAALAAGLADVASRVIPRAGGQLVRHLRAVGSPAEEAIPLAKTLARELAAWPDRVWLSFDDYHLAMGSQASETFVETLLANTSMRMVVASRRRPTWASTRRALYGEIHEVGQDALAFNREEASLLLNGVPEARAAAIFAASKGWPAVIGLAARSPVPDVPTEALPNMLHRYFAEELFQAANPDLQDALVRLAFLPRLTRNLVSVAIGPDSDLVCEEATALGFLSRDHDGSYELHPLLRAFLVAKSVGGFDNPLFVEDVVISLLAAEYWDDAFSVISEASRLDLLPRLLEDALEPLLTANRLSTLSKWVEFGISAGCVSPLLDLSEAELARRAGAGWVGEARALQALQGLGRAEHRYRAYLVAGGCAQQDIRMADAASYFHMASQFAHTPAETARALWGRFIAELELERSDLSPIVAEFSEHTSANPTSIIQNASIKLIYASRVGGLEREALAQAHKVPLACRDVDPFVSTQFLYRLAYAHVMSSHYDTGLEIANAALEEARGTGLDFAVPHILAAQAAANTGLRNFRAAGRLIDTLLRSHNDNFEASNAVMLSARRALAQRQDRNKAVDLLTRSSIQPPTRALEGERLGLLAVTLGTLGRCDEARTVAGEAEQATVDLQARTLAALARAVIALEERPDNAEIELGLATDAVLLAQDYDNLVCAYRAYPRLLNAIMAARSDIEPILRALLVRAADARLASKLGWEIELATSQSMLTRREVEVYDLMCDGMTNREIASALFISEATAKVHVRHIFEKLGVRTRAKAILKLQET
jgi:ATP/maltotriose-dependent transcriptional regulator MalT